jgi:hypothetical protein
MSVQLESLLATGGEVRLAKRDAYEILQKLRARGAGSEAANRLEEQLADSDEVVLQRGDAERLLEELRASGRRWISGTTEPRPEPPREPEPEPEPPKRRWWRFGS